MLEFLERTCERRNSGARDAAFRLGVRPLSGGFDMATRGRLDALVSRIRPLLQADGGDIELVQSGAGSATVRLAGACHPAAGHGTLHLGLETALREEFPDLHEVHILCESSTPLSSDELPDDGLVVGVSSRMHAVFASLDLIKHSDGSVLITGETGTGKEVTARLIHRHSPRASRPFVPVSCALLSESLIESELFGHERGSFTGAAGTRIGRFELAQGGTIFLDDIDDVPPTVQVKLLRVLQNRTIERVGASHPIPVDVRFIAGTKRNLKELVASGAFRGDLYFRLSVFPILLPPLRERHEDIPAFVSYFLRRALAARGRPMPVVSGAVLRIFLRYSWPGNIRELENTCEWIAQTCLSGTVRINCVPPSILVQALAGPCDVSNVPPAEPSEGPIPFETRVHELERNLLDWALEASHGNKSRAAQLLQMKRSTLTDHLRRHGLLGGTHETAYPQRVDARLGQHEPGRKAE